ncbi:MAG: ATP-binding cassette domain-containing protein [Clostridiales bacterium]|nr:ATP-binding cassette domain-containing protein [Clostridiales bacterium]
MLRAENLMVNYGKSRVITGVSFEIGTQSGLAILGRNGVGKTTLLKSLIGILRLESGLIEFDGVNISRMPSFQRSRAGLGYVPQGREILSNLTVRENLEMGMLGHKGLSYTKQLDTVLGYFPSLRVHLERKGGVLSGGLQQQLAIARCLMAAPKVMLLDEPTEGIQPNIVGEIAEILLTISREMHISTVIVEQNLKFAKKLADHFIMIQKGQVVCAGAMPELTEELAKQYLAV